MGREGKMKRISLLLIVGLLVLLSTSTVFSQANHTVQVTVTAINQVAITGGNLTLTINSATGGSNPDDATDNTTCDLLWTTNDPVTQKITVATDLAAPVFTLTVEAQVVSGGTAAAAVTLSTTATDFVNTIDTTVGNCDLAYTASATAAQGTGSDSHTVTYTITNQ